MIKGSEAAGNDRGEKVESYLQEHHSIIAPCESLSPLKLWFFIIFFEFLS